MATRLPAAFGDDDVKWNLLVLASTWASGCMPEAPLDQSTHRPSTAVDTAGTAVDTSTGPTETDDSPWTTADGARLILGGGVTCADPSARADGIWNRIEFPIQPVPASLLMGGGLVIADLDGDERLDLFLPSVNSSQLYFQLPDGDFVDRSEELLGAFDLTEGIGATAADYDGDGDLDLLVLRDRRSDRLLRNDEGVFTDVTLQALGAVGDATANRSMSAGWADWDRDGDLDVAIGSYNREQPTSMWENQGDGTFVDRSDLLPDYAHEGITFMLTWHDLEGDGYPDLFQANDHFQIAPPPRLFANKEGVFTEDVESGYHPSFNGMGVVIGDFNGDERPDVAEACYRKMTLLTNYEMPEAMQGLLFVNTSAAMGMAKSWSADSQRFGWGIDAGDLDNDGDLDMLGTFGTWESGDDQLLEQPDVYWWNEGDTFVQSELFDYGASRGALFADLNGDGFLDVVKRVLDGPTPVDYGVCDDHAWLTVRLRDNTMNTFGIGATVRIEAGDRSWIRWLDAGSRSMFSGGAPEVHFGLDDIDTIDRLEVIWPDRRITTFEAIPTRQIVTVRMPGVD